MAHAPGEHPVTLMLDTPQTLLQGMGAGAAQDGGQTARLAARGRDPRTRRPGHTVWGHRPQTSVASAPWSCSHNGPWSLIVRGRVKVLQAGRRAPGQTVVGS